MPRAPACSGTSNLFIRVMLVVSTLFLFPKLYAETKITSQQQQLLNKWNKETGNNYLVLRAPTGQLLVIVGESHGLPQKDYDIEKAIVEQFKYKGFEGAHLDHYSWPSQKGLEILSKSVGNDFKKTGKVKSVLDEMQHAGLVQKKEGYFWLEKDHKADFVEELQLSAPILFITGLGTVVGTFLYYSCSYVYSKFRAPSETEPNLVVKEKGKLEEKDAKAKKSRRWVPFAVLFAGTVQIGAPFVAWLYGNNGDPTSETGAVANRNVTMTRNIAKVTAKLPKESQMVVIVGNKHVPGLKYHLEKQGYKTLNAK